MDLSALDFVVCIRRRADTTPSAGVPRIFHALGEGPAWNRIDNLGHRLMPLLAVLKGESEITAEDVRKTVAFLHYEVAVREAMMPVVADTLLARAEEAIGRALQRNKFMSH